MKAIKVISPKKIEIFDVPMPRIINDDEVLIKVKTAGICGSDIHIYHGTSPVATYPRIIGHEMAGEVIKIGSKVKKVISGDHVVMDPVVSCGKCYACSIGRPNVCLNLKARGAHMDGGFCEYIVLPEANIYKISKHVSWEEAVLVEPFSVSAQIAFRGQATKNDAVFIMGAGPVGLCVLQVIKKIGAKCIISDLVDYRLVMAKKFGADVIINASKEDVDEIILKETNGTGPTLIIDSICIPRSFEQAVKLASTAGRVVILGFTEEPSQIAELYITAKELDIRGSRLNANKFPQVIEWFEKKEINPTMILSHKFPFVEIKKAIQQIEDNPIETTKVILTFD